jgi:hypothetical protein
MIVLPGLIGLLVLLAVAAGGCCVVREFHRECRARRRA